MKLYEMILVEAKDEYVVKALGPKLVDRWYADTKKQKPANMAPDQVSEIATSFVRDTLVPLDPTPNQKFLVWIAKLYADGNLKQEDFYKVPEELTLFQKVQPKLEKKDIMQYKSLPDLVDAIEPFANLDEPISNKAKAKVEREQQLEGAELVYNAPSLKIYSPKTQAAACELGRGTRWCTAATSSDNMFDDYSRRGTLYVFFINPQPANGPFQMHVNGKINRDVTETGQLPNYYEEKIDTYIADSRDRTVHADKFLSLLNETDRKFVEGLMSRSEDAPPASVTEFVKKYSTAKEMKALPLEYRGPFLLRALAAAYSTNYGWGKARRSEAEKVFKNLGGEADMKKFLKTDAGKKYLPALISKAKSRNSSPGSLDSGLDNILRPLVGKKEYTDAYIESVNIDDIIGDRDPFKGLTPTLEKKLDLTPREYLIWLITKISKPQDVSAEYRLATHSDKNFYDNLVGAIAKPGPNSNTKKIHALLNNDADIRKLVVRLLLKKYAFRRMLIREDMIAVLKSYLTDDEKTVLIDEIKNLYTRRKGGDDTMPLGELRSLFKTFSTEKGTLDAAVLSASTPEEIAEKIVGIHGKNLKNGWYLLGLDPSIENKVFGTSLPANKNVSSLKNVRHYLRVVKDRFILYTISESTGQEWLTVLPFDSKKQTNTKVTINPSQVKLYDLGRLTIKNEELAQSIEKIRTIGRQRLKLLKIDKDDTLESRQWTKSKKN